MTLLQGVQKTIKDRAFGRRNRLADLREQRKVHRVRVDALPVEGKPTLRQIRGTPDSAIPLEAGTRIVAAGVHFLADGETVRITGSVEAPR